VKGKITAHDSLDIRRGATVEGEVTCNRISIQDGAAFCGKVAMGQRATKPKGTEATAPILAAAV
jgi:cytoskeletal protein CcmA (bactofilin family)